MWYTQYMVLRSLLVAAAFVALTTTASAGPKFAALTAEGLPNVQSASAFVVDLDSGTPLFGKNVDEIRSIASTSKLFVALVARRRGIDLEATTTITEQDATLARGGARTRLYVGHTFKNIDLLRAMLIASDNRAPSALGRAIGLTPAALIYEMNAVARELGLAKTRFSDCSGLNGNVSTAKEMAVILGETLKDPVLAEIMQTRSIEVSSADSKPRRIHYRNTNRPIHNERYEVLGGKTGYTDKAGYCLAIGTKVAGRRIGMVFLGAHGKLTRFGDFKRVFDWLGPKPAPNPTTAAAATALR